MSLAATEHWPGEPGRSSRTTGVPRSRIRRSSGDEANPQAIGVVLGGHGITAWGRTSEECEARSLEVIRTAAQFIADNGRPEPFGPVTCEPVAPAERHARAAALAPGPASLAWSPGSACRRTGLRG
jgi:rhamnose utilization protein RhaD (predicted bifunctional aldolase and dehydrogenase)